MVTSHWIDAGYQEGWNAGETPKVINAPIPAGATLKRLIVSENVIEGRAGGDNIGSVGSIYVRRTIVSTGPEYADHIFYTDIVAIEGHFVALYDSTTLERIYTVYFNTGDERLLINQQLSFGKRTGLGFNVRYTFQIAADPGGVLPIANSLKIARFRLLYETMP